nr:9180_t:CDS:2 [Entrophospora candida]
MATTTNAPSTTINKLINNNEQIANELIPSPHRFNQNTGNKFSFQDSINRRVATMNSNGDSIKNFTFYIMNPKDLRDDHPVLHYFYLCTLVVGAFVSLFIIPVVFAMLAAIGGICTPFILSIFGSFFALSNGGSDLVEITKLQILQFINDTSS